MRYCFLLLTVFLVCSGCKDKDPKEAEEKGKAASPATQNTGGPIGGSKPSAACVEAKAKVQELGNAYQAAKTEQKKAFDALQAASEEADKAFDAWLAAADEESKTKRRFHSEWKIIIPELAQNDRARDLLDLAIERFDKASGAYWNAVDQCLSDCRGQKNIKCKAF